MYTLCTKNLPFYIKETNKGITVIILNVYNQFFSLLFDLFVLDLIFTIICTYNAKNDTNYTMYVMYTTIQSEMRYNYNIKFIS